MIHHSQIEFISRIKGCLLIEINVIYHTNRIYKAYDILVDKEKHFIKFNISS